MLLLRAFWFGILLSEVERVAGYYSSSLGRKSLGDFSSKLPLQLNCSKGVPIPSFTIDKSFTRDEEKQVLQRFYLETSGYNWTIQRPGWTPYDNGTEIDHCRWAGVTCDKSGYVIGLCLNNNNLTGRVPNFLWKLRNLMLLCLPSNRGLEGELKDFVFQNMTKLLRIDLAFCSLSGVLPNDLFSSLKSLVKIQLCCQTNAAIYGSIPPSITDLKELRVLSLGENSLSGPIPKTMGKLKKVWFLDLEFMPSLSGDINIFLGMTAMQRMHLTHAGLIAGEFPKDFGSYFPHMEECQLGNNSIYGLIPPSVNKMKDLTKLLLCGNRFRGKIPKELGELPSLRILDLSYNPELQGIEEGLNFHGSPKLEILVLRNNPSLNMPFKDLVDALAPKGSKQNPSPLRVLDISYCAFTGTISPMIWTFSSLIGLHLKHNKISGTIPPVLNNMLFLSYADFSENPKLEGPIPNTFYLLQSLRVFDISNNNLMRAPAGSINQTSGVIQDIMRIDPNSRTKGDGYSCPLLKLHSNNGRILLDPSYYYKTFCVCDQGYFGQLGHCKRCIPGASCSSKTIQSIDTRISLDIKRGYWPCPSPDNVSHLIRCPGRSDINGADLACNPGGQCKCWVNTSTPDRRTVCDKSCICHSGNTDRVCSKCAKNYFKNGFLCKECAKPFLSFYIVIPLVFIFLLALWGMTKFCSGNIKVKFGIAATEFIILLILRTLDVIPGWIFEISVLVVVFFFAGMMKNTRGIVTILVFHFQVLGALISDTETSFPQFIYSVQHFMGSIFNLNFLGISCSIHILFTPLGKYLVVFLFPLGCLLLIWMYYGFWWILCRNELQPGPGQQQQLGPHDQQQSGPQQQQSGAQQQQPGPQQQQSDPQQQQSDSQQQQSGPQQQQPDPQQQQSGPQQQQSGAQQQQPGPQQQQSGLEQLKFQCLKVSITCLIITYFPVVKHTLAVISPCENDDDLAVSFMRHTPWLRCDNSDKIYEILQVLGWLAVIMYGVFTPVALWVLLYWRYRSPENIRKDFDPWLGSIYLPYKKEVQVYFEVMKLFRKFSIALLLTFIPNTLRIQTFAVALVLMMSLIYQVKFEPYEKEGGRHFGNVLETLSLIVLQQSVILLRFASYDTQMSKGMIWSVLAFNAVFLLAFLVALFLILINVYSARSACDRKPLLTNTDQQGTSSDVHA